VVLVEVGAADRARGDPYDDVRGIDEPRIGDVLRPHVATPWKVIAFMVVPLRLRELVEREGGGAAHADALVAGHDPDAREGERLGNAYSAAAVRIRGSRARAIPRRAGDHDDLRVEPVDDRASTAPSAWQPHRRRMMPRGRPERRR